jgi:predicted transcriptional regulator of viral defense system
VRDAPGMETRTRNHDARRAADRALARLARKQHGLFTTAQAIEVGLDSGVISRRLAAAHYERRWPGVYAIAGSPDGREARYLAALLLLGGDAALSHATAASVHGLEHRLAEDAIHLTVRQRTFTPRSTLRVHRSVVFTADDVVRVDGLRVTTVTWTLTDLARLVDVERLRRLVSAAVRAGQTDAERLRALLDRRRQLPGRARLVRIVDELSPLEEVTRGELESLFVRVMTRAGLPPDAVNHPIRDATARRRELDAVYLEERLPIELDSRAYHGTLLDWHDDLRRENAIKLAGWRDPLRFSYADLRDRPDEVVALVRVALGEIRDQDRREAG